MTIQEIINEHHACMKAKGFHNPSPSVPALLAMVCSELGEAIDADRKNKRWDCNINKHGTLKEILERPAGMFKSLYELYIKDTFEDELAGACLRIFDLCGLLGIEPWSPPESLSEWLKQPDIPGNIMEVMAQIGYAYSDRDATDLMRSDLSYAITLIFAIAKKIDIDLWAHIEAAMRYNRLREYRHGNKKY